MKFGEQRKTEQEEEKGASKGRNSQNFNPFLIFREKKTETNQVTPNCTAPTQLHCPLPSCSPPSITGEPSELPVSFPSSNLPSPEPPTQASITGAPLSPPPHLQVRPKPPQTISTSTRTEPHHKKKKKEPSSSHRSTTTAFSAETN